jgi:hypothetical protein
LLAAMFTLPVAGTALNIADQHLHPRNMATAAILLAVDRVLAGKMRIAAALLLIALAIHPIMAAFGISFCIFLGLVLKDGVYCGLTAFARRTASSPAVLAASPLTWIFAPPTPSWRRALNTRTYYFLSQWRWYEWLGAIGPLILFWLVWRYAARRDESMLARFGLALVLFGAFQQALAMILLAPPALIRIRPLQPMRYLHIEFVFLVLIAGGLIGRHFLGHAVWRWILFLAAANGGMFISQRVMFRATEHLELPWRASSNSWLQAFAWIRANTPADAYFALDPQYLAAPGEDYHSFRALAERSQLADALKDASVATQVPDLATRWAGEVDAQQGWRGFQLGDFERLKGRYRISWVVVSYPAPARLTCIWHNAQLTVCRIPGAGPAPTP